MAENKKLNNNNYYYSTFNVVLMYLVGGLLRYWLLNSKYQQIIENHVEVSTPLNSWKRVAEGLFLQKLKINPYDGDLLHEPPINLRFYRLFLDKLGVPVNYLYLMFDMGTALLIYFIAKQVMFHQFVIEQRNRASYVESAKEFLLSGFDICNAPVFAAATFLFHPYMILNCVGRSTVVFNNFFLSVFLLGMLHKEITFSTFSLAACTINSFYPIVLIIPLILTCVNFYKDYFRGAATLVLFITNFAILHIINLDTEENYLNNVWGFILTVPDLQPNIGLFWYFFTEMFDHFRELFIYSFQINVTILYLVPLTIKFRNDPFTLSFGLLFIISIFKSYPCIGDVGYVMSLLPCLIHLLQFLQQSFLVGVSLLVTTILAPILWYLWIYTNSANANFYFGVNLAFAIANIFFVTDVLFAHVKREFILKYGRYRKLNGKDALLVLE